MVGSVARIIQRSEKKILFRAIKVIVKIVKHTYTEKLNKISILKNKKIMKVIQDHITVAELSVMSKKMFNNLVKAVIDIEKKMMVVDAEFHADQEQFILEEYGSEQENVWGINLHPIHFGTENFIEFDSMINVRPSWGNTTRGVDDLKIQERIKSIVQQLVIP